MAFWGWIPHFTEGYQASPLLNTAGIDYQFKVEKNEAGYDVSVEYKLDEDEPKNAEVLVYFDGLLVIKSDGIEEADAQVIYDRTRSIFHIHQTHPDGNGLPCVEASDRKDAVNKIILTFITPYDSPGRNKFYSEMPNSVAIMNMIGMAEYGLRFIERFGSDIDPDITFSMTETFEANKHFLETRIAHMESDNSRDLSKQVNRINKLVYCISIVAVVIAGAGFIESLEMVDRTNLVILAIIGIVTPLLWYGMTETDNSRRIAVWFKQYWDDFRDFMHKLRYAQDSDDRAKKQTSKDDTDEQ